jgi:hypothetical protein
MATSEPLNPNATHKFKPLDHKSRTCYRCCRDIFDVLHITAMEPGDVLETFDHTFKVTMENGIKQPKIQRVIELKLSTAIASMTGVFIIGPAIRMALESAFGAN